MPPFFEVTDWLLENGFQAPEFGVLRADHDRFKTAIFQPSAELSVDETGVRATADQSGKFLTFLSTALSEHADIAITPEYSCPWKVVREAIETDVLPPASAIWVLGCESITWADLEAFTRGFPNIHWQYEDLSRAPGNFLNPLCYLFRAVNAQGALQTVGIIQFKSRPCSDGKLFIERNHMINGSRLYRFSYHRRPIFLCTLICSDAFNNAWTNAITSDVHSPYLLLHIQLNPAPRNVPFTAFKNPLFTLGNSDRDLISVNWARGTQVLDLTLFDSYSVWQTQSPASVVRKTPAHITQNHRFGIYVSRWDAFKAFSYSFNTEEHVFIVQSTKPSQAGAAQALRGRTGVEAERTLSWNVQSSTFVDSRPDDGFGPIDATYGFLAQFLQPPDIVQLERSLVLLSGKFAQHSLTEIENLSSFCLSNDEYQGRLCHTHDPSDYAVEFRRTAYSRAGVIPQILSQPDLLPPGLKALAPNGWVYNNPHSSPHYTISNRDESIRALVVYLGEEVMDGDFRNAWDRNWNFMPEGTRHLLVMCSRKNGVLISEYEIPTFNEPDDDFSNSILRV